MTNELTDLARAAVALPGWRWPDGMRWTVFRDAPLESFSGRIDRHPPAFRGALPDLTDPATAGLLWQMLGRDCWMVELSPIGWMWQPSAHGGQWPLSQGASCLGEACARVAVAAGRWDGDLRAAAQREVEP
jgi:hypothetical protein